MDEERVNVERHFDKSCTDFQSENPGRIIKSTRKFGIEIEMVNKSMEAVIALSKSVSRAFGFEHDGSILTERGSAGIEVVSPILSGDTGESAVVDLFDRINGNQFEVNTSCGLHVHLDGTGFKNKQEVIVRKLNEVKEDLLSRITREDNLFMVKKSVVSEITKTGTDKVAIAKALLDEYIATGRKNLYPGKMFGTTLPELRVRPTTITVGKYTLSIDCYDYAKLVNIVDKKAVVKVEDLQMRKDDYLCVVKGDNSLRNTKTLLYVYSVFNDVFMAMLPKSRRGNVYCQNLALSFAPNSIEALRSYTELEAAWYKTRDLMETVSRKNNHYDDSRYYGVNLHTLFAKYGTVEIRSHSATLSPNKVLYWVALHQDILDKIVSGQVSISDLRQGAYLSTLDEKVDFLIESLQLRTSLRKYVKQRIQYFTDNIK